MMNDSHVPLEPERYELSAAPIYSFDLTRREFFTRLGCGIAVFFVVNEIAAQESGRGRRGGGDGRAAQEISAWLHIHGDGTVTVFTGKVEVGQDIRTSLAQAVAEELPVPFGSIRLVMGDTRLTPFDAGTFGSRTTPVMSLQLRRAAATARELLIDLAAKHWQLDRAGIEISEGHAVHGASGKTVCIGKLAQGQQLAQPVSSELFLKPAAKWETSGRSLPKVNGRDFVTGKHAYTSDLKRPGMLHGKVLRPPAFGASLVSADLGQAEAMHGVTAVRDGNFIGVAAPTVWEAEKARNAIRAEWKTSPQPGEAELFDDFRQHAEAGSTVHWAGSIDEGLASADRQLKQLYQAAYIAHAPLEPRAAVAEWDGDRLTVWTGTQRPFGVRSELARAFGLAEENVRVIVPDTGSGYGGKHTGEAAVEAARLARAAKKPVKLVWTREEEFTWAYFRPAALIEVASGVNKDGRVTAWDFKNYNAGTSAIRTLYSVPNQRIHFCPTRSPLRQGSYRVLAATVNHFARETHMDELAHLVKMDPLEFRLKNLEDPRLRAVFEAAAKQFDWGNRAKSPGQGFGVAGGFEKGSYVASCAAVTVKGELIKVDLAVTAFECGAVVNPDHLKSQIEGCVMMGIGGALSEAIHFDGGKISNPRFSQYRVPRFSDLPVLETVLVNRPDLPSAGAGETPIVAIAPAISNAIFDAIGERLRSLPMKLAGTKAASNSGG